MKPAAACIPIALASICGCVQRPPAVEMADPPAPAASPASPRPVGPCRQVWDGNAIAQLQAAGQELIARLEKDPSFAGAWYEHHPCYRLVLSFTDERPRSWVNEAAEPQLRSYLSFAIERSRFSRAEFETVREEIFVAVRATRVRTLIAMSTNPQRLDIGVRTEAEAQLVRSVIPARYRLITRVIVGGYAEPISE